MICIDYVTDKEFNVKYKTLEGGLKIGDLIMNYVWTRFKEPSFYIYKIETHDKLKHLIHQGWWTKVRKNIIKSDIKL